MTVAELIDCLNEFSPERTVLIERYDSKWGCFDLDDVEEVFLSDDGKVIFGY